MAVVVVVVVVVAAAAAVALEKTAPEILLQTTFTPSQQNRAAWSAGTVASVLPNPMWMVSRAKGFMF